MKIGIILVLIGLALALYFGKVKFEKEFLSKLGILVGILFVIYGLILSVQPEEYVQFTKTTISLENNSSK